MSETRKYTVADLFAGVGGLSYGFSRNDRFEIILANEMQKDIAKAYTLNHPAVNMLQGDIKDLSEDILRQAIGNRTVDVVVGGPPWLDGEDTGMTLEAYFGDSICQTRNGFVTMDKKGYSFDLED